MITPEQETEIRTFVATSDRIAAEIGRDPNDAVGMIRPLLAALDEARRERDELRATLAKLSEAATAFDDDLSSDCDCLSRYDLRDAVKAADNAAKVSP